MKFTSQAVAVSLCVFTVAGTTNGFASQKLNDREKKEAVSKIRERAKRERPTAMDDIASWVSFGGRWAGALGQDGKLLALYDLSYPELLHTIPVATITEQSVDLKPVLMQFQASAQNGTDREKEIANEAIEELNGKTSIESPFTSGWWKKIPWKNKNLNQALTEPASFRLSDISWESAAGDSAKFMEVVADLEAKLDQDGQPVLGAGFLSRFEVVQSNSGEYTIRWTPPEWLKPMPKKIIDFESKYSGLLVKLEWELLEQVLSNAIDTINVPVASALLGTAVSEVFHLHNLLLTSHQEMAMEMLNSAHEGGLASRGFPKLNQEERESAGEFLMLSESSLTSVWRWIGKSPRDGWKEAMTEDSQSSSDSMAWLKASGNTVSQLNGRFGIAQPTSRAGSKQAFVLANQVLGKDVGPSLAIDYANPQRLHDLRVSFEIGMNLVHFGTYFIPMAGSLVRGVYDYFVTNKMDRVKTWESRLISHLEERQSQNRESWAMELQLLEGQRINPFEMNQADSDEQIQYWKHELKM